MSNSKPFYIFYVFSFSFYTKLNIFKFSKKKLSSKNYIFGTVRGKRVALWKSVREYTSVGSQQLETGKEWQPFELVSIERHVDYCRCPIKDSIERVRRAAFRNDRNWAGADLRAQHERCNYTEIFRASGAKRPPLYTTNRLERYAPSPTTTTATHHSARKR